MFENKSKDSALQKQLQQTRGFKAISPVVIVVQFQGSPHDGYVIAAYTGGLGYIDADTEVEGHFNGRFMC